MNRLIQLFVYAIEYFRKKGLVFNDFSQHLPSLFATHSLMGPYVVLVVIVLGNVRNGRAVRKPVPVYAQRKHQNINTSLNDLGQNSFILRTISFNFILASLCRFPASGVHVFF